MKTLSDRLRMRMEEECKAGNGVVTESQRRLEWIKYSDPLIRGWYFSDDGKSRIFMNSHSCSHQGKTAEIKGYIINFTFYVLSSSNMQTIIQADNAFEDQPITIYWESENMFWFESTYNAITTRYFYTK